jgi:thiamine biosynthesis lipoprotein
MNTLKNLILIIFISLLFTSCHLRSGKSNYTYHHEVGEIFTTHFNIRYAYNRSLLEEIMAEFEKFNQSLNPFRENSIISKVNRNEPVELDSFFITVFEKAMEVSAKSGGAFDITVSPFINAWGFGFQNMDNVTPEVIDSLRAFVGFEKIRIDANGRIEKDDPRISINMSAIAKGYACDVIANLLRSYGVENFMIEIGGEIVVQGVREDGNCWRLGITKPSDNLFSRELQTILNVCNKAMATSGNYRNFYIRDGRRFAHTIDPRTGFSSEQDILSATVIADNCMTADAYATVFMVLGLEKSRELAKTIPGLYYYFIYTKPDSDDFCIAFSESFEQFFAD